MSGSHTSVSGPAAGLFAIEATQIDILDGFEPFLFAVTVVGIIQIAIGIAIADEMSSFFPSSVIIGLLAATGVLSWIDSRVPAELALDLGNVFGTMSIGSGDYGVSVAGVKLILVLGHDRCGAVTSSIQRFKTSTAEATGISTHLTAIVNEVPHAFNSDEQSSIDSPNGSQLEALIDDVAKRNVMRTVEVIKNRSEPIREGVGEGQALFFRATHDVKTGKIDSFD